MEFQLYSVLSTFENIAHILSENMFPLPEIDWKHSDLFFFDQNTVKILKHPVNSCIKIENDIEFAVPETVPYQLELHKS